MSEAEYPPTAEEREHDEWSDAVLAAADRDGQSAEETDEGRFFAEHYERLRLRCERMEAAVLHYWRNGVQCPCGARPESPDTHPHVMGCPVGEVLGGTVADNYRRAVSQGGEE